MDSAAGVSAGDRILYLPRCSVLSNPHPRSKLDHGLFFVTPSFQLGEPPSQRPPTAIMEFCQTTPPEPESVVTGDKRSTGDHHHQPAESQSWSSARHYQAGTPFDLTKVGYRTQCPDRVTVSQYNYLISGPRRS